jgi:diguanylate cyclase (GGDEF)-like protein
MDSTVDHVIEERLQQLEFVHRTAGLTSWVWDIERDTVAWFGDPEALLELAPGSFGGRFCEYLPRLHPDDVPGAKRTFIDCLKGLRSRYHSEERLLRPDGSLRWLETFGQAEYGADGSVVRMAGVMRDVSERKQMEAHLLHQMHHDSLTDLPNRALLGDRLAQAVSQAQRKRWTVGVLFVDLDRFKLLNDGLGHAGADAVLREAAIRLSACVRGGDTVARVAGDEFAVVLSELAKPHDAGLVARKILDAIAAPFRVDRTEVLVTASIGIATFPRDAGDGNGLLHAADAAMLQAKQLGGNNFQLYSAALSDRASEKLLLRNDLRRALERGEFLLHFQPRQSLHSGDITAFEALLRWNRPGSGLVSPAEFVPLLEESGLIVPVGAWVIRAACAQIRAWAAAGFVPLPVAVNVSAKQFMRHDLMTVIERALADHDVMADLLEVEITETDLMQNGAEVLSTLERLRERRIRVAIDDFGTGYSSLAYLKRYRVDALKLDRSFVKGLPDSADDASIARAVIGLAHNLGLKVVAEGVEDEAQRAWLAAQGCDESQGYLLARPLAAGDCQQFLGRARAACCVLTG